MASHLENQSLNVSLHSELRAGEELRSALEEELLESSRLLSLLEEHRITSEVSRLQEEQAAPVSFSEFVKKKTEENKRSAMNKTKKEKKKSIVEADHKDTSHMSSMNSSTPLSTPPKDEEGYLTEQNQNRPQVAASFLRVTDLLSKLSTQELAARVFDDEPEVS